MSTIADDDLVAIDRFVSSIYWSDDDITLSEALPAAIDEWTALAAAEHNESHLFSTVTHVDALAASLHELLAAVERLGMGVRPGLTLMRALSAALADWSEEHLRTSTSSEPHSEGSPGANGNGDCPPRPSQPY